MNTFEAQVHEITKDGKVANWYGMGCSDARRYTDYEVAEVGRFMNGFGERWWLAGGTGLELYPELRMRQSHKDTDISIDSSVAPDFFDYCIDNGYEVFGHEGVVDSSEALSERENAFVHKIDFTWPGPEGFEIIFLRRNKVGDVQFAHDPRLTFPRELFEEPRMGMVQGSTEIPLQPVDVILFHKVYDGRRKDAQDIRRFVPGLWPAEYQRLESYVSTAIKSFIIEGNEEVKKVGELCRVFPLSASEREELQRVVIRDLEEEYTTLEDMLRVAKTFDTPRQFIDKVKTNYPKTPFELRAWELGKAAFLLCIERMTPESFINYEIRRRLGRSASNLPAWRIQANKDSGRSALPMLLP